MNILSRAIGNHAWFFRDGTAYTVPSSGTAGRASKPGATDPVYIDLGILEQLQIDPSGVQEQEVWAPSPGQLRLYDVIETKPQLKIMATLVEMSPLSYELLAKTGPLTSASTQYNPLEGVTKRGWLRIQQYDHNDALFNTLEVFTYIRVTNAIAFNDQVVKAEFQARVLHSTLNTGALA